MKLLNAVLGGREGPDYRNWEWYYLNSLCCDGESIDSFLMVSHPTARTQIVCHATGDTYTFKDRESGNVALVLKEEAGISASKLDPAGKRLACIAVLSRDHPLGGTVLKVYELASQKKIWERKVTPGLRALDWNPSGDRLATTDRSCRVRVWNALDGSPAVDMQGYAGVDRVVGDWEYLKWSPDARWITAGRSIWNASTGEQAPLRFVNSEAFKKASGGPVDWDPSSRRLAVAALQKRAQLTVWELESEEPVLQIRAHPEWIDCVSWAPDGESFATGGSNLVRIWDASSGELQSEFRGNTNGASHLSWIDGGQRIASTGYPVTTNPANSNAIYRTKVWSRDAEQGRLTLPNRSRIAWTASGELVARTEHGDGWTYEILDPQTGKRTGWVANEEVGYDVRCVSVGRSDQRLAAVYSNGDLRLWDGATNELIGTIQAHPSSARCVAWNPDGSMLATSGSDGFAVWDVRSRKRIAHLTIEGQELPRDGQSVSWSPDGKTLVGVRARGIRAWRTSDWREILQMRTADAGGAQFCGLDWSPTGDRFVSCTGEFINVWDAMSGAELLEVTAHSTDTWSVAWSPNGRRIASGGGDHRIRLWDAETGEDMLTLPGHKNACIQLAWSPDGRMLASCDGETAIIWNATAGYARVVE